MHHDVYSRSYFYIFVVSFKSTLTVNPPGCKVSIIDVYVTFFGLSKNVGGKTRENLRIVWNTLNNLFPIKWESWELTSRYNVRFVFETSSPNRIPAPAVLFPIKLCSHEAPLCPLPNGYLGIKRWRQKAWAWNWPFNHRAFLAPI